jgi:hypothetical protein
MDLAIFTFCGILGSNNYLSDDDRTMTMEYLEKGVKARRD